MSKLIILLAIMPALLLAEANMVRDTRTGLIWEDTPHVQNVKITHPKAQVYCHALKLGGHDDWRLPTIKELLSIVDYTRVSPATFKTFNYTEKESFYWTSTPVADADDEFWGVNFKRGASSRAAEYYDRYVRCVRDLK